jgi:hypothetical protein
LAPTGPYASQNKGGGQASQEKGSRLWRLQGATMCAGQSETSLMSGLVVQENATGSSGPPVSSAPSLSKRVAKFSRNAAAIIIWLYVAIKPFIIDFDVYVIDTYAPYLRWVIDYKFFIYIGLVGICAILFKKWQIVLFSAYVLFYPIILLLWIIPYFIFRSKSWIIAFAAINTIVNFFTKFRRNAILLAVLCLSSLAISTVDSHNLLIAAIVALFAFVVVVYLERILSVFRTDTTFRLYKKAVSSINQHFMKNNKLEAGLSTLPLADLTEKQLEKRNSNLEQAIVVNRVLLFLASKMKAYQASKLSLLVDIFAIIGIVIVVSFAMAWINMALYKIDNTQFKYGDPPSPFYIYILQFQHICI